MQRMVSWITDAAYEAGHSLWVGLRGPANPDEVLFVENIENEKEGMSAAEFISAEELPPPNGVRLVCISDTHEAHESVRIPECDILLHCGDLLLINRHFSPSHSAAKITALGEWLTQQPAKCRIVIGGNHDAALEALGKEAVSELLGEEVIYLENETVLAQGLTIYGSPWSSGHSDNNAFQADQAAGPPLPDTPAVDVLMTHGPPPARYMAQVQPRVSVSGHIHARHGVEGRRVNCSIMGAGFHPTQCPVVLDLPIP